jgi:hypothetical protein
MTVIPFKKNSMTNTRRVKITPDKDGPVLETTVAENLIIKKFLSFAVEDVKYQIKMVKKSRMPKEKLDENIFASGFIIEYLNLLIKEVTRGIESADIG